MLAMRRWLTRPFWVFLALLFLAEAWLWEHLAPVVEWFVALVPWERFKAHAKSWIEHLPPWASLVVFAVPLGLILIPLKFVEFWAITSGSWLIAIGFLFLAKIIGVAVSAFLFEITRDKLMQIGWFASLFEWLVRTREWARQQVEPIKARLRRYLWLINPSRSTKLLRRMIRIFRRRAQDA